MARTDGGGVWSLVLPIVMAGGLWFILFSPWTKGAVNFWGGMSVAAGALAGIAVWLSRREAGEVFRFEAGHIWVGLASAAVLYFVFLLGDVIASRLFGFAKEQVAGIYASGRQASPVVIGGLLLLLIGPAEEVFWRGFVQRRLAKRSGDAVGFVIATVIYAGVHIWSFNFMLVMAALVCGAFWGAIYWRYKSVVPGIISHAVWDVAIFVILPIK